MSVIMQDLTNNYSARYTRRWFGAAEYQGIPYTLQQVHSDDWSYQYIEWYYTYFRIFITHAPVHINDFRGVRARYVKRTG